MSCQHYDHVVEHCDHGGDGGQDGDEDEIKFNGK